MKFFKLNYILIICLLSLTNQLQLSRKQKNKINLGFSVNNNDIDLLYISLYSVLENSDKNTIYIINIQTKKNLEKCRKDLIYSLELTYFNCFIHFIIMKTEFKNAYKNNLDVSTYFRLTLPVSCPDINRIIFIDADTITLKDLTELYTLNFNGNYFLARLDNIVDELDEVGLITNNYINAGILLMDLYSLRKYNYVEKFLNHIFTHNNYKYLYHHAQSTINYLCHDKIGLLKFKYHMWPFDSYTRMYNLNAKFRTKYDENEFASDFNNPFIVHFPGSYKKNWNKRTKYHDKFNEYKRLTNDIREAKLNKRMLRIKYILFLIVLIAYIYKWLCILFKKKEN